MEASLKQLATYCYNVKWLELWQFFELTCTTNVRFPLGRLGLKQEMSGKLRVFAMVDAWTQWLLYPLHRFIFKLIRRLPTDGTFDQIAPLRRVPWGKPGLTLFSLDLSAATDRLPLSLQVALLDYIFPSLGKIWAKVLTGREYTVPKTRQTVKYAVGQPMGALSSWAMLALTHHFIVQVSA
jgi:hypothetical protein